MPPDRPRPQVVAAFCHATYGLTNITRSNGAWWDAHLHGGTFFVALKAFADGHRSFWNVPKYLRKRGLKLALCAPRLAPTAIAPPESAPLSSTTFHSPSTRHATSHKNVCAHPLSAPAPSRASPNCMPVTKSRRGASLTAPAQPATPGPPPQCFGIVTKRSRT
jgi:hypothetical protein